jgi:hypothetical protein
MSAWRVERLDPGAARPACLSSADAARRARAFRRFCRHRTAGLIYSLFSGLYTMDIVEMNTKETQEQQGLDDAGRPRRDVAKRVLERGQRLRNRAGVLIGLSLGIVALLTMLD